ncbi:hypothetical protein MTO96_014943 [Rhipicephalus appendiculatus]
MSTSALEAGVNDAPCSEDVEKKRFTAGKLQGRRGNAIATELNLAATTAQTSASVSSKPRPPGGKRKWDFPTAYLRHSLKTPFTVTLPPTSKLIIVPTKPHHNDAENKNVPNNDDADTTVVPQDLDAEPSEEQLLLQQRKYELERATTSVSRARRTHKTVKRNLKKLNDFLFTEKTFECNGKRVTEISLSRFALEVLEKRRPGTEHNHTDEAAGAPDRDTSNDSEVDQSDRLFMNESEMQC